MRTISLPHLEFSAWFSWENRGDYSLKRYPGVYLLAINRKNLEGKRPSYNDVVYVGMTVSKKGLIGRWNNLLHALKGEKGRHSGGDKVFDAMGEMDQWKEKLFVSAMGIEADLNAVSPDNLIKKGAVAYLEYEVLAEVFKKTGKLPEFNTFGK